MHQSWHLLIFEILGIIISYSWLSQRKQNRSVCLGQALILQKTETFNHHLPRRKPHFIFLWSRRAHSFGPGSTEIGGGESAIPILSTFVFSLSALTHGIDHCVNLTRLFSFFINSG